MILQALTAYYEAMLKKGIVAPPGWDKTFKVSFWLELNDSGELIDVIDQRHDEQRGKKTVLVPRQMSVPAHVKRSSGVAARYCALYAVVTSLLRSFASFPCSRYSFAASLTSPPASIAFRKSSYIL